MSYIRATGLTYGRTGPWHVESQHGAAVCGVQRIRYPERVESLTESLGRVCPQCMRHERGDAP